MSNHELVYYFYKLVNTELIKVIRIAILLTFPILVFLIPQLLTKLILFLYSFFFINEVFILFKINRTMPKKKVGETKDLKDTIIYSSKVLYDHSSSSYDLSKRLLHNPEVKFFIKKLESNFTLIKSNIVKEDILKKAEELAIKAQGSYISSIDLFSSYLLLSEAESKLLEKAELNEIDVINILYWVRNKYLVDRKISYDIGFGGAGVGEFFVYGWNYEIKKYAKDITSEVLARAHPPSVVGRTDEYNSLLAFLAKNVGNNAILVGESGTGRNTLVEYFAYNSYLHTIPYKLSSKRVFELLVERLLAGADTQGQLEKRLDVLLIELLHTDNVILFIQNLENIFGGGGYKFDISGVLFNYLKKGKIQIIGTVIPSLYKEYLENKETVSDFFEIIRLKEPDKKDALFMIFEKVPDIEYKYKVNLSYRAILTAVELSSSYLVDHFLPGKAIDLLEDVASSSNIINKKSVDKPDVIKKVEEKTHIVLSTPTQNEKKILLNLESEMHKRIIGQNEAVNAVASAIRRLRSGFKNLRRPISVLLFMGPTGVGKTETAKALASLYFGKGIKGSSDEQKNMIRLDMSEFQTQDSIKRLLGSLPGEEKVRSTFIDKVSENPFSLILLDEFEKAHSKILDIFLQVFDDGRLTDNLGRTVSFSNAIIIATSNAGSEIIRQRITEGKSLDQFKDELLNTLMKTNVFKVELINRFDDVIVFKPLTFDEARQIARLILIASLKQLEEQNIFIEFDNPVVEKIAQEGFEVEYGARNLRHYIAEQIENEVSKLILEGKIKKSDRMKLLIDESGKFVVS